MLDEFAIILGALKSFARLGEIRYSGGVLSQMADTEVSKLTHLMDLQRSTELNTVIKLQADGKDWADVAPPLDFNRYYAEKNRSRTISTFCSFPSLYRVQPAPNRTLHPLMHTPTCNHVQLRISMARL
jgi:hypothetical protein